MSKKQGKRYLQWLEKVPKGPVSLADAVAAVKAMTGGKFDQTIELSIHLGIDPRQADQAIRGSISLPHGIGQSRKVIAFCEGDDVERAKAAGATEAGADELIKKVADGWLDFDVAVSTPKMMRNVSRLGRVLGPQGKMPSPKSGTVVEDIAKAVTEYGAGKVEYRNDAGGNVQAPVGKMSFDAQKIVDNAEALISHLRRIKPSTSKGTYIKKISLSGTMTPGVRVQTA